MGIKFRDVVEGCYYKGYDSMPGDKSFFYVIKKSVSHVMANGKSIVDLHCAVVKRGKPNSSWRLVSISGDEDLESLIKRVSCENDVVSEGIIPCPQTLISTIINAFPASSAHHAPVPAGAVFNTPAIPVIAQQSSKPSEVTKAQRNIGKSVVQGNAYSETCLRCGRPTKQIPMMRMYWCPECEPE